ncbi:MAG: M48 family metallopeptidase, partial [Alphaproteobacteria bacterium]|nr:M48 family metallopeptidase [Alphaproteobacteria bacterium]
MPAPDLYPAAPEGVPENFARPSTAYRMRVFAVLAGLVAFLVLYLVLIAATGYAGWWLVQARPATLPHNTNAALIVIVAYVGGVVSIAMLLLFLVKGLFTGQSTNRSGYVAVTRGEQPELFRFIDLVCEETNAPRPAGVYISPDVNAAVFYDSSLVNLIVPPRKYLLIGAGLVNAVNLREFKAVLAHEFGHFSQNSLALGTYVYVANRVLRDIVHGRDSWDDVLAKWCRLDIRLSFPAWALRAVVWVVRRGLEQVFKGINLLNFSLSRQMEFNADDVAVSVAGSDAIVTALCRIEFADHCHGFAAGELSAAADHGLHSRDIFHHQECAVAHLRAVTGKPDMGVPPPPPARVFDAGDASSVPQMWRSHPRNSDREANAKRHCLAAADDERSPWLLFAAREELCARLSAAFYKALGRSVAERELDDAG